MNHHHKLLQTDELYSQCINMIKNSVASIQQEIGPIKKFLGDRRKEIIRISINASTSESEVLESTREFYEHILKELMSIEQACEQCLLRLKIDLLTSTKDRMQPPSYLSLDEMRRGYETYCDAFDQTEEQVSCRCTWENIPKWSLENTRKVLAKPREIIRSKFDESDLKFKQEMIYLRTKMFRLPRTVSKSGNKITSENTSGTRASIRLSLKTTDFMEVLKQKETSDIFSMENELSKISSLKFIDGQFTRCDIWSKILNTHGNQCASKWHLVLCPQIEQIAKKRLIPMLHLNPCATFDFLSKIEENGANFILVKRDLIDLLQIKTEIKWLKSLEFQFNTVDGNHLAATLIQSCWRGYLLRKRKRESDCLYIAASFVWLTWLRLKKKRELHERYLQKMLISLQTTRELSLKLSKEFNSIIRQPHVVIHLVSIGQPLDIRQTFSPKVFRTMQNMTSLRIAFVRNPMSEVIYILPVKPTDDLLLMYSDFVESICPEGDVAKRITFIALSQLDTFRNRSINVSRVLHCSKESLDEIRKKIAGKAAYFLPWFIDECDMRLAGNLGVPLLSPDMELQRKMLNSSTMSEMIEKLGLLQPPHARDIKDYDTLCKTLAQFIALHTEICVWLIRLNFGILNRHYGIFLINHISVPFMPLLRRERKKHGDNWKEHPSLREEFLQRLLEHLPNVVSSVTRLSKLYSSWKEFYLQIQKFGCLLQAIPVEKDSKTISVSLFLPGKASKEEPRWMGTSDRIFLDAGVTSTYIYMIPQSSLDTKKVESTVNKFAVEMQNEGFVGYLTVDCYCYMHKYEDKLIVLLQNVRPFYSFVQSYIDWLKFAIGGIYNQQKNQFVADVSIIPGAHKRKSPFFFPQKSPQWNETTERYAIVITQLYHTRFSAYRWPNLKDCFEECDIMYDAKKKQGSSIILHDGEIRNFGMMMAVSPCMTVSLSAVHNSLTKLHKTLMTKSKRKIETNLPAIIDLIAKLSVDYQNLAVDECSQLA